MKKGLFILIALAAAVSLAACGSGGNASAPVAQTSETPAQTQANDPPHTQETESAQATPAPNNTENTVIMTVDIPDDIPVADADGKIPSSDDASSANRKMVVFGNFYQNASGNELSPVEWIVLDEKDGYSLLLSRQLLASMGWVNEGRNDTTWAEADLRKWLNNEFWGTAFTTEEQDSIALYDVTQPQNPRYNTPAGEPTMDKVTLLSYQELVKYMPTDAARKAKPTAYAQAQGCYRNTDGDSAWWLRSPGATPTEPEYLSSGGALGARTHYNDEIIIGVRPVVWVETSALIVN